MEISGLDPLELQKSGEFSIESFGSTLPSIKHPERNEDTIRHSMSKGFAMVLDGMGGQQNGDKASRVASDSLTEALGKMSDSGVEVTKRQISEALVEASQRVGREGEGGGTTATVVKFLNKNKEVVIGSVGDSRAYIFRRGKLELVTDDDDILSAQNVDPATRKQIGERLDSVASQADLNMLSSLEKNAFDQRNAIGQALDGNVVRPHIYHIPLQEGDKILLTSDGVHDNLTRVEIGQIVANTSTNHTADILSKRAQTRSQEPHIRSKHDDISTIVLEVGRPKIEVPVEIPQPPKKNSLDSGRMKLGDYAATHGLTPAIPTGTQPEIGNPPKDPISQMSEFVKSGQFGATEVKVRRTLIQASQPDQISNLTSDQARQLIQLYAQYNTATGSEFNRQYGNMQDITLEKFDEAMKVLHQRAGISLQKPWWMSIAQ